MANQSKVKSTACKLNKCFANKDGRCSILYDTNFDGNACPFFKKEGSVTNGITYPFNPGYSADGIPSSDLPVKRSNAEWAKEWDAVTEPHRRKGLRT